jgi:competence protein ComEC
MSTIHFLNVGHGDCTVIQHDSGRVTVIDCNNCDELDEQSESEVLGELGVVAKARFDAFRGLGLRELGALEKAGYSIPLTNPIDYLRNDLQVKTIFRYVQTHPDLDHMRGLSIIDSEFSICNFWDTENDKTVDSYSRESDKDDWATYQRLRNGSDPKTLLNLRGSTGAFFNKGDSALDLGDGLHIYAPTKNLVSAANDNEDWNELSYVLALKEHGRTVVFGGDAGVNVWNDVFDAYGDKLDCDVLKASHHGRESGYHEDAVKAMRPGLTVISVGKIPDTDASDQYRKHSERVWTTRWKGDVTVRIDASGAMRAESRCDNKPIKWKLAA